MKIVNSFWRFIQINYVLFKHACRFRQPRAVRIRQACEDLGPIFIKIGQVLSTRLDLLPDDVGQELTKLQDQVPAFCGHQALRIVENAFNKPINTLFKNFDTTPLAAASIAQVHAATMLDGTAVVVKILRPAIKKQVQRDLDLMLFFAQLLHWLWPTIRRFKPRAVLKEIKKNLLDELDLMREAANASQLRRNFLNSPLLYVPAVYWSHTKHNVLTLERIYGTRISDIDALNAQHTNLRCLAERGVEIFFTQVFRDCFFHADMHPGNVWVATNNPENPQYLALDFGIIGTLGPRDQHYLAENFLAFFKRDYRRVAELHVESGWVPANTRIEEFEAAIRCVCEPIFEKPLKEISFGKTLLRLFQTARRFNMEIQPQLILLQKTLISVEGLGRQLYPDLDLWSTAKPFLEGWMRKRISKKLLLQKIKSLGPFWLEKLPELPGLAYKFLQNAQNTSSNPLLPTIVTQQTTAANTSTLWYYFGLGATSTLLIMALLIYLV